jgi:hypothetical protein
MVAAKVPTGVNRLVGSEKLLGDTKKFALLLPLDEMTWLGTASFRVGYNQ